MVDASTRIIVTFNADNSSLVAPTGKIARKKCRHVSLSLRYYRYSLHVTRTNRRENFIARSLSRAGADIIADRNYRTFPRWRIRASDVL